jgi:hypothetical protein
LRKRPFTVGLPTNDTRGRFSLPLTAGVSDAPVDKGTTSAACVANIKATAETAPKGAMRRAL